MTTATTSTTPEHAGAGAPGTTLKVLIADKFEQSGVDGARRLGCLVEINPELSAEDLPEAVQRIDPDVLIVRSTKVLKPTIEAANRLSLIIRAGAGYDNIDVAAASAGGIFVANCPGKNAHAVAELTWGLILACDRRIPDQSRALCEGTWNKKGYGAVARGLRGRTLGIVGLGRIGSEVAAVARAFGMKTIAWSRSLTRERAEALDVGFCRDPLEVAANADIVSIHVAATPETKHLVSDEFLAAMKENAYLINTSRGSVVDEAALARAVRDRNIRAGLDVYENQPTPKDTTFSNPIVKEPCVFGTHHCGASTAQAQQAIADETVRILDHSIRSGQVPNCVNRAAKSPATCQLTVRHLNRPGVLAHVFHVLSDGGINVEEMDNVIYEGAEAACAHIRLDSEPTGGQLDMMRKNENILSAEVLRVSP